MPFAPLRSGRDGKGQGAHFPITPAIHPSLHAVYAPLSPGWSAAQRRFSAR